MYTTAMRSNILWGTLGTPTWTRDLLTTITLWDWEALALVELELMAHSLTKDRLHPPIPSCAHSSNLI